MAKYINKDDVYEWLVAHLPKHQERIEQILNDVPSIDIVHCKDCIHNGSIDTDCPFGWKDKKFNMPNLNDYCSYGERKDERSKE